MSRGRRYSKEPKLNIKKVVAVILAFLLIVMFGIAIKNLLNTDSSTNHLVSTTYFLLNKDNKWGVMDNNAKIIIEPTYEDAIIIPNNKKAVFICVDNKKEDGTYQTKVLNAKGKEIITGYDKVMALENYDKSFNLWYEDNILLVEKEGKYGLIDFEGKSLLNTDYDHIETLKGIKNSIITEKDSKKGLVNNLGKVVIDNQYEEITSLGKDTKMYIVKKDNQYGIDGVFNCKYQDIKAMNSKDIFYVKENNEYKVINQQEEKVFNEKFSDIEAIQDNIIIYQNKNQFCAYDIKNNKKLDKTYKELKYTANDMFIVKSDNNYGIIDINNEEKIKEEYVNINFYEKADIYELEKKDSDYNLLLNRNLEEITTGVVNKVNYEKSYMKVWTEEGYTYYNLNGEKIDVSNVLADNNLFLSKKDNQYGFIDKNGNVVVDYRYDDAMEQNEFGYIAVKKDGLWGCLDKNGNSICSPKYNLDTNLLIDFIGEYHLGEDLNLMYYTNKE